MVKCRISLENLTESSLSLPRHEQPKKSTIKPAFLFTYLCTFSMKIICPFNGPISLWSITQCFLELCSAFIKHLTVSHACVCQSVYVYTAKKKKTVPPQKKTHLKYDSCMSSSSISARPRPFFLSSSKSTP